MIKFLKIFAAGCLFLLGIFSNSAFAQSQFVIGEGTAVLVPDKAYFSPNQKYFLVFQSTDGNLVVYRVGQTANTAIWAANSQGGKIAVLQTDGNFVVYKSTTEPTHANKVWSTDTYGDGPYEPWISINDVGSFRAVAKNGLDFSSPSDPEAPAPTPTPNPTPSCTTLRQFPICVFRGTTSQFNGWVLACTPAEAQAQAAMTGASYGRCPGT